MQRTHIVMLCVLGFLLAIFFTVPDIAWAQDPPDRCTQADRYLDGGDLRKAEREYSRVLEQHPQETCAVGGLRQIACQRAAELVALGELDLAKEAYGTVLAESADESCALGGLDRVRERYCAQAAKLFSDNELAIAEEKYKAILQDRPSEECALDGLGQVREGYCLLAARLFDAGRIEEARARYEKLLSANPDLECATEGLERLPTDYDRVLALKREGMYNRAWEQLEAAIRADPNNPGLEQLGNEPWVIWQRVRAWLRIYPQPAVATIVAGIIAAGLGLLLVRFGKGRESLQLDIEDFTLGALTLDVDPCPEFAAQVEQAVVQMRAESGNWRPGLIAEPLAYPVPPAGLSPVAKEAGLLWDFVTKFWPANTVALSGMLQHSKQRGAGVCLKLVHRRTNAVWDSQTIWQRDLDPDFTPGDPLTVPDFGNLAPVAATWVYWTIYQEKKHKVFKGRTARRLAQAFGTANWQSYVANLIGARYLDSDKLDIAEEMVRRALELDHENRYARFNRAMIEVEKVADTNSGQDYTQATRDFEEAIKLWKAPRPRLGRHAVDPVSMQANYQLGAIEIYRYLGSGGQGRYLAAAKEYLETARDQVKKVQPSNQDRRAVYDIVYACAQVVEKGTYPNPEIAKIDEQEFYSSAVLYNLACYYSLVAKYGDRKLLRGVKPFEKALEKLESALQANPEYYGRWAVNDPSLQPLREEKNKDFEELLESTKKPSLVEPLTVTFSLPIAKIKSSLSILKPGTKGIVIIIVLETQDPDTAFTHHTAYRYDGATFEGVFDQDGRLLVPPIQAAKPEHVLVDLELDKTSGTALDFAAHLVGATTSPGSALYLLAPTNYLQQIEGIGPRIARELENAGITTFARLAATRVSQLQRILKEASIGAVPDTWPKQAGLAAVGKWEELAAWQAELTGGRED